MNDAQARVRIAAALAGDQGAYTELFEMLRPMVAGLTYRYFGRSATASECEADALARILMKLHLYKGDAHYHDLMDLTEELIKFVAMEVNGTTKTVFNGVEIDLGVWTKLSMREAIIRYWPPEAGTAPSMEHFAELQTFFLFLAYAIGPMGSAVQSLPESPYKLRRWRTIAELRNAHDTILYGLLLSSPESTSANALGKAIAAIFEAVAEDRLIQPTIIYDFPLAVSPLSKVKPDEPDWVERFEFYIGGFEVGNAFSELNDAVDQRQRFLAQVAEKARGDDEAMEMDEDYVRALGYGLPPTGGEGIGIDRLTMILTGSKSIREVILFPLLRPQKQTMQNLSPKTNGGRR